MAFSLRKMFSNINYFKQSEDGDTSDTDEQEIVLSCSQKVNDKSNDLDFEVIEPDSTSKQCSISLNLPDSVKRYAAKKTSYSDTDILTFTVSSPKRDRRRCKKLKVDIDKANKSMVEGLNKSENNSSNIENTPKHILLNCKSADIFSEKFKGLEFDIFDAMSEDIVLSPKEEPSDAELLSDNSESDISLISEERPIKMCRKVEPDAENEIVPSPRPESFGDIEIEQNEDDRRSLLLNYQMRLEKLEHFLNQLLSEFRFHIEVSNIFQCRKVITALPGSDVSNIPRIVGNIAHIDSVNEGFNESWNIMAQKEDNSTKFKIKKQLMSMKHVIEQFVNVYLKEQNPKRKLQRSLTYNVKDRQPTQKRLRFNMKKRSKHFDFPDIREAMVNLFNQEPGENLILNNITYLSDDEMKCTCHCHRSSSPSIADSGLITKNDQSISNHSITSSLGNFCLDSSTLSAYSESLDQVISYNSFHDTSLFSTLLQKAAIERITFYVQVHSIQLKCEHSDEEYESKNIITFHCPTCKVTEMEENGLLRHILSQFHCEKIHFLYKTAYIKKCMTAGKEIQPSTVLNPMTMYRDENKIVCFGDAMYACSLCFENLIIGESILMAHCSDPEHVDRRERLSEMFD